MISWRDVYKVVIAMVPLYVALGLGFGSVKWWKIFTADQCNAINRLVTLFILPFLTFEFTLHTDPFAMNYRFLLADAVAKIVVVIILAIWVKYSSKGSYSWSITMFSLSTLTNTLVVGVPLVSAMYGKWAQDLVVQLSVVQAIAWFTLLLLAFELKKAGVGLSSVSAQSNNGGSQVMLVESSTVNDVEEKSEIVSRPFRSLMKIARFKLALNPNVYAGILGITWAFIANRWRFQMPSIIEGSVLIMSRAGTGMAMFSMGLFMALQEKIIACGPLLTVFGMVLKLVAGPAAAAIGAMALGLRGDVLRLAIIQAALPQSITSFIFAKEYEVHADVLSTAVIFGTLASLPVLIAYYIFLGFIR
ncbi:auxin efflux carrier component 5-like [Typha angustifolia]|uniref:auxin efflux carrier component 5-like n=1 Tax=Typha angustifolia TaxID=59011 RepID=UPI003C2E9C45